MQPPIDSGNQLWDYRNASYQGGINHLGRHGFGIIVSDSAEVLFAQWKNNEISGRFCLVSRELTIYGNLHNRELDGPCYVHTEGTTLYCQWKDGQSEGQSIYHDVDSWSIILKDGKKSTHNHQSKMQPLLSKYFSTFPHNITLWLSIWLHQLDDSNIGRISIDTAHNYFGFKQNSKAKGLGCVINIAQHFISCGQYSHGILNGLGRHYSHTSFQDGTFIDGKPVGVYVSVDKIKQEFIVMLNGREESRKASPNKVIKNIKKQFHLRGIYFLDQIVLFDRLLPIQLLKQTKASLRMRHCQLFPLVNKQVQRKVYKINNSNDIRLFKKLTEPQQVAEEAHSVRQIHALQPLDTFLFESANNRNQTIFIQDQKDAEGVCEKVRAPPTDSSKSALNSTKQQRSSSSNTLQEKNKVRRMEKDKKRIDLHRIYKETGINKKKTNV